MKGIILAGGVGSRLRPLTKVTNQHLLPIYDRPMIYYPLQTLCYAGIREIMIVTGGNSAGDFLKLLGNGREFGLPHIAYTYQEGEGGIADALKLLSKEIITPSQVDRTLHFLAPMLILGAALMTWVVIPWGPGLQVADLNVGILYLLAFGAVPALGVTLAGWASMNKYSLFGGMRAVVQYVSYEVPAGIVIVVPVLLARTMSLQGIVAAQSGPLWNWFVFQPVFFVGPLPIPFPIIGLVSFVYYLIAGLAEVNRTPFDHVEADSELTGGFTTEYSGMQFALFFLAEYANSVAVGLLGSSLFLGGYHTGLGDAFDNLIWPLLPGVLVTKAAIIFLVFVWVRGTLPRFRYDQLMQFAWKRMLPVSLALVSLSALAASLTPLANGILRLAPGIR